MSSRYLENGSRFSIYDAMEAAGWFRSNPANLNSRDASGRSLYEGPVPFPRMVYHPQGRERVLVPGTVEVTPYGPQKLGEQWEIINREVKDQEELDETLASGWHLHPAEAIASANESWRSSAPISVPPMGAATQVKALEERNRRLEKELEEARAQMIRQQELGGGGEDIAEAEGSAPKAAWKSKVKTSSSSPNLV